MQQIPFEIQRQLIDTLCEIFWYKKELLRFLSDANIPQPILRNTENMLRASSKRPTLRYLLDELLKLPDQKGQEIVYRMAQQMSRWSSFNTVNNPDAARRNVHDLARLMVAYEDNLEKDKAIIEEQRRQVQRQAAIVAKFEEQQKLLQRYFDLVSSTNPQERGHELERLLHELFKIEGLNPGEAFAIKGEQVDGAFELNGIHYLVEAKWVQQRIEPKDISWFQTKIERRLSGTLGLLIAVNGFTDEGVRTATDSKCIILMDGDDLYHVLEPRVDLSLKELLQHKITVFSRYGIAFSTAREMLKQKG